MDKNYYKNSVSSLLPEHEEPNENYDTQADREKEINEATEAKQQRMNAAQLARMKMREKYELEKIERRKTDPTFGMTEKQIEKYNRDKAIAEENIATIEVIEESPEAQNFLASGQSDLSPYAGTTKRDVVKLLNSLNINLDMHLTQADTYNLLSCLLTCNEAQLRALYSNNKVPLAIKTVIKRLQEDAKLGNIETIEKLWDRIFGKATKTTLELPVTPGQIGGVPGIIPNTVVSREAYMVIRDTIIGK